MQGLQCRLGRSHLQEVPAGEWQAMRKQLRFRQEDVKDLAGIQEEHTAGYGGLLFIVTRRPKNWKYHPGPGVRAHVTLGWTDSPQYYYKAKNIRDGKDWCRCALTYILHGTEPFGDHDEGKR